MFERESERGGRETVSDQTGAGICYAGPTQEAPLSVYRYDVLCSHLYHIIRSSSNLRLDLSLNSHFLLHCSYGEELEHGPLVPCCRLLVSLAEHHRLGAVQEEPLLAPPFDCCRERLAFHVAALFHQFLGIHTVVDSRNPLLNNGPLVQVCSDKMCRGANNLDSPFVRLVIGLGSFERGQE